MEKYYKTELHAHTKPVSGCSDIETKKLVNIYRENGYDSVVITNHFTSQLQGESNMHPNHNSRVGLAARYSKENNMIAICGSDFHHYGHECLCGILTNKPMVTSYDVAEALKNKEYKMFIGDYVINI